MGIFMQQMKQTTIIKAVTNSREKKETKKKT